MVWPQTGGLRISGIRCEPAARKFVIARRLQNPLAEFVKIDPKAVGVGRVSARCPCAAFDCAGRRVESCPREHRGVDLNTASAPLLAPCR